MIRKIITHGSNAHADDILAVALLLTKFPEAEVHRVHVPEDVDDAIVVDIGQRFDNERFFDHHQDPELPASVILVIRKFFPEIDDSVDELQWISDWDTTGPFKTQQKWNVKLPDFPDPIAETILRMFSKAEVIKPGDWMHEFLQAFGREFLDFLREQSKFIESAKKAAAFKVKGLKVVRTDENVPVRFVKKIHKDVAIIVQPNQRTPGAFTLTRVDDHPRVDFNRIKGKVPAHFIHANGFMAVVDPEHINAALDLAIQ